MKQFKFDRQWTGAAEGRSCGTCAQCCTWLGIEELKKWTGQACKHLDGKNPEARCSIYAKRPEACQRYFCMWRAGWGPDELRPDKSQILITVYAREDSPGNAATVIVTDFEVAKPLLDRVALELLMSDISEVRIVNYKSKMALLYKDGKIYQCRLLPARNFEELHFEARNPPIAAYQLREPEDADSGEQGSGEVH
jgi:Fe-S-cluster containining protein